MAIMMHNSLYTHESKSYKEEKKITLIATLLNMTRSVMFKNDKRKGSLVLVVPFAAEWLPSFPCAGTQ